MWLFPFVLARELKIHLDLDRTLYECQQINIDIFYTRADMAGHTPAQKVLELIQF